MSDQRTFDIIEFTGQDRQYYGDSIYIPDILLATGKYVKASEVAISLGHSRYGGPVVDLPPGVDYPAGLRFAAQLDLAFFAPHDKSGLLPRTGQLLFFADILTEVGQVFYTEVPNDQLVRVVREHEEDFFAGVLIDYAFATTESLASRYREPEDEEEVSEANADGKLWDYFAGSERSKIFGIYTNCQLQEEEILAIAESDHILLLQVGEGNFNDEGVFSVLIPEEALRNRDFNACSFTWAQS
ncbi:MAG: DUF1963 domain-containing protein [Hymenobacter sp.]|nr:MAG: DUF1963 domain-containing protein [Hymenobacter sp.]